MPIPAKKRPPMIQLESLKGMTYGPPKIGKTTFLSGMDNALFMLYEDGAKHLSIFNYQPEEGVDMIRTWADVEKAYRELKAAKEKGELQHQVLIHDTADIMYELCRQSVFGKKKIEHESDLNAGKGWDLVTQKFRNTILSFEALGLGQWFTSHADWKSIKNHLGGERNKCAPSMPKRARETLIGLVDVIIYADQEEEEGELRRYAFCHANLNFEAGGRFMKRMPDRVPLNFKAFRDTWIEVNAGASPPPAKPSNPPPPPDPEPEPVKLKKPDPMPPPEPETTAVVHRETLEKGAQDHPRDVVLRFSTEEVRKFYAELRQLLPAESWSKILESMKVPSEKRETWAPSKIEEARNALIRMIAVARQKELIAW